MYDALGLLVDFFNANDKGLSMADLHTKEYKVIYVCMYVIISTMERKFKQHEQPPFTSTH